MDFSRDYTVHYYEADTRRRLTLPALLCYFEDIAIMHSASCGFGLDYFDANRCGWMLLKWDLTVHRLPSFGQSISVVTRVHAMKRFLADREFSVHGADGSVLVSGRSNWLFVDTVRRRPIRITENIYTAFGVSPETEDDFITLADVQSISAGECPDGFDRYSASVKSSNTDIDTNAHVNNVSYVKWALDSLPFDLVAGKTPSALRVQYRKELSLSSEASVSSLAGAGLSRHTVSSNGEECCSIAIDWV